jgi:hypothetical protein
MRWVCLTALVFLFYVGCGGTETTEPINQAPTIEFTFTDIVVRNNFTHDLTVAVGDPEGDPLTVTWSITSGTLTPQNSAKTVMEWDPPNSPGVDTVTVSVTDGEFTRSVTEQIKRGTLFTMSVGTPTRTFTEDDSPYIVQASTPTPSIGEGQTITLEAGVEWYITKDENDALPDIETIAVEGTLMTNGTGSKPVLIRPNDRTLRCSDGRGWWGGFDLTPTGAASLSHTEISYGEYNIRLSQGSSSANLQNCRLLCSSQAAIKMENNGVLTVNNCQITDNGNHGIDISSLVGLPTNVTITNNDIRFNGHTGIYMDLLDETQSVPITIRHNRIEFNASNGIALMHAVWPTIENNDISKNNTGTLSNIRLLVPFPDPGAGGFLIEEDWDSLLTINNYWGGTFEPGEASFIEQGVWDTKDNSSLGTRIIVEPWANDSQYGP